MQTYDDLYNMIEHIVLTYAEVTDADLYAKREAYEKDHYREILDDYLA